MKYLIVFCIALSGCGVSDFTNLVGIRRFKVGDCLIASLYESELWDKSQPAYKVIEVGKHSYLIHNLMHDYYDTITFGHLWEDFYQKVDCPK